MQCSPVKLDSLLHMIRASFTFGGQTEISTALVQPSVPSSCMAVKRINMAVHDDLYNR
jgi:hypothetical protein